MDDVTDDIKYLKRRFTGKNPGQSFSMKKPKDCNMSCVDDDYISYLNGVFAPHHTPNKFSFEDDDDPNYVLFLSMLKKDGTSYMLEADEKNGLMMPLIYEEDEFDNGREDTKNLSVTSWTESIDEDYAYFCNSITKSSGKKLIYERGCGPSVVYNGLHQPHLRIDNGEYSLKQMSKLSLSIDEENSSSSSKEDEYSQHGKQKGKMCSKFRTQLMKILRKPYDREEHQKLWHDITLQKAQHKHIDLRSGSARFMESNKLGKSYLEHHGDLKRKVNAAAKHEGKQLNLLRGFFFWLRNLTQEGSFIPWNDEQCLAVQPGAD